MRPIRYRSHDQQETTKATIYLTQEMRDNVTKMAEREGKSRSAKIVEYMEKGLAGDLRKRTKSENSKK